MNDDIVTRLRDLAMKEDSPWANIYDNVMRDAAAEIERLRSELAQAKEDLKQCADELNAETWGHGL
jgi:hypothetical protein